MKIYGLVYSTHKIISHLKCFGSNKDVNSTAVFLLFSFLFLFLSREFIAISEKLKRQHFLFSCLLYSVLSSLSVFYTIYPFLCWIYSEFGLANENENEKRETGVMFKFLLEKFSFSFSFSFLFFQVRCYLYWIINEIDLYPISSTHTVDEILFMQRYTQFVCKA